MKDRYTFQEEQLRKLSEELSSEVNTADLWDAIEGKLPPIKKRRDFPIFWWIMGNSVVLLSIVAWLLVFHSNLEKRIIFKIIRNRVFRQIVGTQ